MLIMGDRRKFHVKGKGNILQQIANQKNHWPWQGNCVMGIANVK